MRMNEIIKCHPGHQGGGIHRFTVIRTSATGKQKVEVLAKTGRDAIKVAHAILDGAHPVWPELEPEAA